MALIIVVQFISPAPLSAETAYLTPSADTSLLEHYPANNTGGQLYLSSGTTQIFTKNRALIKFDLAQQLPAGARITAASLTVEVVGQPVDGDAPTTFELRRLLRDWGEGDKIGLPPELGQPAAFGEANWTHRFAFTTNTWAEPGGLAGVDFSETVSSERYVYGEDDSPYVFNSTSNLVADLQFWLSQPGSNFGWMLISRSEDENFSARRFASREDPSRAPLLAVDYFVPALSVSALASDRVQLSFRAAAGQNYTLEYSDDLHDESWHSLTNIPPQEAESAIEVQEPVCAPARFYRLLVQ